MGREESTTSLLARSAPDSCRFCALHCSGPPSHLTPALPFFSFFFFSFPPKLSVGKGYKLRVHVVSDCFCGLDQELSFSFDVNSAAELAPYEAHEEDKALENEPTLFEQVMTQHADVDSSDEEDDEPTPAKGKPAPKKSAAQEQDDGEESD